MIARIPVTLPFPVSHIYKSTLLTDQLNLTRYAYVGSNDFVVSNCYSHRVYLAKLNRICIQQYQ